MKEKLWAEELEPVKGILVPLNLAPYATELSLTRQNDGISPHPELRRVEAWESLCLRLLQGNIIRLKYRIRTWLLAEISAVGFA